MAKLPRVSGQTMVRLRQGEGFQVLRVRGSHHYMEKGELRTSVPVHGSRELKIGTLWGILRENQTCPGEFVARYKP